MFKKLSLKPYLLSVFGTLIVLTAVITFIGVIGLLNTKKNIGQFIDKTLQIESAVKTSRIEVNVAARNLRDMLIADDTAEYGNYTDSIDKSIEIIKEQLAVFKQIYGETDGYARSYEDAFQEWFRIASRAITQIEQGNRDEAKTIILNECAPALNALVDIAENINMGIDKQMSETISHNNRTVQLFVIVSVSLFAAVLIVSISFSLRTTSNITGTAGKIRTAVDRLSKGDIGAHVDYKAQNEFGELANLINLSFEELSGYIRKIDYKMNEFASGNFALNDTMDFQGDFAGIEKSILKFSDKMNFFLNEISMATEQVQSGAKQVSEAAQNLAQGTTEQASSVQELSSTLNEISENVTHNAEHASKANTIVKETAVALEGSIGQLDQLLNGIDDISKASEGIRKIIKVIDEIAFQTNILALNAAVEAARAGQAGKGFAVVAGEVRNLAGRSSQAAQETTVLIENSLAVIRRTGEIADKTSVVFEDVEKKSDQVLAIIREIAAASMEQATAVSQISEGIDQVSAVIQNNSATSQQSAAASENLAEQANMLNMLVGQFKTQ